MSEDEIRILAQFRQLTDEQKEIMVGFAQRVLASEQEEVASVQASFSEHTA